MGYMKQLDIKIQELTAHILQGMEIMEFSPAWLEYHDVTADRIRHFIQQEFLDTASWMQYAAQSLPGAEGNTAARVLGSEADYREPEEHNWEQEAADAMAPVLHPADIIADMRDRKKEIFDHADEDQAYQDSLADPYPTTPWDEQAEWGMREDY